MPIVGFNFDKLLVERKKTQVKGPINVKNNAVVDEIKEEKTPLPSKEALLRFNFTFTSKYEPDFGEILLKGNILYMDEPKKIKQILNEWKKDKKMSKELTTQLINAILLKCNIKALALSQEINLPPQIPMPKLTEKETEKYIG